MKRAWCSTIILLLASCFAHADLITNGDFSSGLANWNNPNLAASWDSLGANGSPGGPSLRLDNNGWLTQQMTVEAGQEYKVSFLATLLSNTSGQTVYLYSKVEEANAGSSITGHLTFDAVQGSWNEFSYNFVAQQTSSTYYLNFLSAVVANLSSPAAGTVAFGLDSVSVTAVPEPATMGLLSIGAIALIRRKQRNR